MAIAIRCPRAAVAMAIGRLALAHRAGDRHHPVRPLRPRSRCAVTITERTLRRLLESLVWEDQRALWAELRAVAA